MINIGDEVRYIGNAYTFNSYPNGNLGIVKSISHFIHVYFDSGLGFSEVSEILPCEEKDLIKVKDNE